MEPTKPDEPIICRSLRTGDLVTVNGRPAVFRYAQEGMAVIRYADERLTRAVCRSKIEQRPTG